MMNRHKVLAQLQKAKTEGAAEEFTVDLSSELSARALGIRYGRVGVQLALRGELRLLQGTEAGWDDLRIARRARWLSFFLAPSSSSARLAALCAIEHYRFGETEIAKTVTERLARGFSGTWESSQRLVAPDTPIVKLAFLLCDMTVDPGWELFDCPEYYALLNVTRTAALADVAYEAFEVFLGECKNEGNIPPGSRLTCAAPFACMRYREDHGMSWISSACVDHEMCALPFDSPRHPRGRADGSAMLAPGLKALSDKGVRIPNDGS